MILLPPSRSVTNSQFLNSLQPKKKNEKIDDGEAAQHTERLLELLRQVHGDGRHSGLQVQKVGSPFHALFNPASFFWKASAIMLTGFTNDPYLTRDSRTILTWLEIHERSLWPDSRTILTWLEIGSESLIACWVIYLSVTRPILAPFRRRINFK